MHTADTIMTSTGHKHHVHIQNYIIPLDINPPPPQY